MSTEAQITANRLNAQKSTGPRTEAGKAIVSRNGEKHTKLSRNLLVSSQSRQESSSEFSALCDEYYESLDPVGPLEEMLVDRIVTAVWRTRRARQAESGEIALGIETGDKQSKEIDPIPTWLQTAEVLDMEDIPFMLAQSIPGCEYLLLSLHGAHAAVRRDKRLTTDTLDILNTAFRNRANKFTDPLRQMTAALDANPAKLDAATLLQRHQAEVLNYLERQISYYEEILAAKRSAPDAATRARQDAAMLPAGNALDNILRYEAALDRQLFHAMDRLEKLQSRRHQSDAPAQNSR